MLKRLIKKLLKEIRDNFISIATILNLIILTYQGNLLFQQTKISKEQIELQKELEEVRIQPFFEIIEEINGNNKNIKIFNSGESCYINVVKVISFLKIDNYGKEIVIPFIYFGDQLGIKSNNGWIYSIRGYNNSDFLPRLKNSSKVKIPINRDTYIKINYTDKRDKNKTLYFSSKGEKIDEKTGKEAFEQYYKLIRNYSESNLIRHFDFESINIDIIKNVIKNPLSKEEVKQ